MHFIFSKKVICNFHKVQQISIASSERKSHDPTLCLYDFGHAHPWTCWIPLDFDNGVSSLTGSALAVGRPFYYKLNLLIFTGGASVKFRRTEQQYFYYCVSCFAYSHQTKHNLTSSNGCWRDAGTRRSV
jgi:hypothetical protein